MTIITEFIEALNSEISALKKGKGSGVVTVYDGKLLKQVLELFIYQFNLENFLVVLEDTPAILEVNGLEYDCNIISVNGQQVQISINEKLSESIPTAKIKTNTWYLYELLKKKYEEYAKDDNHFHNSDRLFSGNSGIIDSTILSPTYSIIDNSKLPNDSQQRAIYSSLNKFLSIIWGPPGTGKTVTIARIIESHLNEGRRILLLSHANNAVDQALEKVAEQTKSSYYKDCMLVRLGTPKAEVIQKFEKQYPLVLLDKIAEHKSSELIKLRLNLINEIDTIRINTKGLEVIVSLLDKIKQLESLIKEEQIIRQKLEDNLIHLNKRSKYLESFLIALRQKLERAMNSGILKRTIFGLNPENIRKRIKDITAKINSVQDQIRNVDSNQRQSENKIHKYDKSKQETVKEIKTRAQGYKNIDEVEEKLDSYKKKLNNT